MKAVQGCAGGLEDESLPAVSRVEGLGDKFPLEAEAFLHFATTWKDLVQLKLFQFGELKAAVYAL